MSKDLGINSAQCGNDIPVFEDIVHDTQLNLPCSMDNQEASFLFNGRPSFAIQNEPWEEADFLGDGVMQVSENDLDVIQLLDHSLDSPIMREKSTDNVKINEEANFCPKNLGFLQMQVEEYTTAPKYIFKGEIPTPNTLEGTKVVKVEHSDNLSRKYVLDPIAEYLQMIPLINSINPRNYSELIVQTLRVCLHQVPLDDFYNLVFNSGTPDQVLAFPFDGERVEKCRDRKFKKEGLTLCYYVLETFRLPFIGAGSFAVDRVHNMHLFNIKLHEVQRVFLAVKIMFDSVIGTEVSLKNLASIPRPLVKDAYSIICEKLFKKYSTKSNNPPTLDGLVVGLSHLGRIAKLVYPNLTTRRFGRRGESQYHYIGITWNKAIVDDELLGSIEVKPYLRRDSPQTTPEEDGLALDLTTEKDLSAARSDSKPSHSNPSFYSFIRSSSRYPAKICPPRNWDYITGQLPHHSEWAKTVILKSATALKKVGVDVNSFIGNFNNKVFSPEDPNFLHFKFSQAMHILSDQTSSDEAYLHLYLTVLLLILPMCLSYKEEVSSQDKIMLRSNLSEFLRYLESNREIFRARNINYLLNFINIIRKMVNFTILSLSSVKTTLVSAIMEEIVHDMTLEVEFLENHTYRATQKEESIYRRVAMAVKAMNCDYTDENLTRLTDINEIILEIAKTFGKGCVLATEYIAKIPENMTEMDLLHEFYDLPFQIFKILARVFHDVCLSNHLVLQLPIAAINQIVLHINNDLQSISFNDFSKRDNDVSKDTFKAWWVYSAISGEYMCIFSEIVALSGRLA